MSSREDVRIPTGDGTELAGWHYLPGGSSGGRRAAPQDDGPRVVVMAHGYGAVKEMYLDVVAETIAATGVHVVVHDHRGVGGSDAAVRGELDPQAQIADFRDAITFALDRTGARRAGIWGTSFCGGHVLVLGATDDRVAAVWAQIPTISGSENLRRRIAGDDRPDLAARLAADRMARQHGEEPQRVPLLPDGIADPAQGRSADDPVGNDEALWMSTVAPDRIATWSNSRTLRSIELYGAYEPGHWMSRIGPTPLAVACLDADTVVNTDLVLDAYATAREPKELVLLPGGHFDAYGVHLADLAGRAAGFFDRTL